MSKELKGIGTDLFADNPIAAVSDITLTPSIADEHLPVEPSAVESHDGSRKTQELSTQTDNEATICVDIIGTYAPQQSSDGGTPKRQDDQTNLQMSEKPQSQEDSAKANPADSGSKNLETLHEETPEAEEKVSEIDESQPDEKDSNIKSTANEVHLTAPNDGVELEMERIAASESDDGEPDSASVFSTCDEWLESPRSGTKTQDQATSPRRSTADIMDSVAGLPEPDEIDPPPMGPLSRGSRVEMPQPAPAARSAYSHGHIPPKTSGDRKSATVSFHCDRKADGNVGDRLASSRSASSSFQAPIPSKHRPKSAIFPSLGGRVPYQSGRAPPTSKGSTRPTPVSAGVSHTFTRSFNNASTRCNPPLQPHDRARSIKPFFQERKPAWK